MRKNSTGKKIRRKIGRNIGKSVVEMFCVVLVCSMVLGAVQVMVGNQPMNTKAENSYVIEGCVEHPYVKRPV